MSKKIKRREFCTGTGYTTGKWAAWYVGSSNDTTLLPQDFPSPTVLTKLDAETGREIYGLNIGEWSEPSSVAITHSSRRNKATQVPAEAGALSFLAPRIVLAGGKIVFGGNFAAGPSTSTVNSSSEGILSLCILSEDDNGIPSIAKVQRPVDERNETNRWQNAFGFPSVIDGKVYFVRRARRDSNDNQSNMAAVDINTGEVVHRVPWGSNRSFGLDYSLPGLIASGANKVGLCTGFGGVGSPVRVGNKDLSNTSDWASVTIPSSVATSSSIFSSEDVSNYPQGSPVCVGINSRPESGTSLALVDIDSSSVVSVSSDSGISYARPRWISRTGDGGFLSIESVSSSTDNFRLAKYSSSLSYEDSTGFSQSSAVTDWRETRLLGTDSVLSWNGQTLEKISVGSGVEWSFRPNDFSGSPQIASVNYDASRGLAYLTSAGFAVPDSNAATSVHAVSVDDGSEQWKRMGGMSYQNGRASVQWMRNVSPGRYMYCPSLIHNGAIYVVHPPWVSYPSR